MRKGCCRMAAAFSLRKEYQMTGKNERKLKKWTALFLAAAMSLTACGRINGKQHIVRVGHFGSF